VVSRIAEADRIGAPRVAKEFSKCGIPCESSVLANVPASQRGLDAPSNARRTDGRNGREKPVRTLFSRLAQTGISTVKTSGEPGRVDSLDQGVTPLGVAGKVCLEPRVWRGCLDGFHRNQGGAAHDRGYPFFLRGLRQDYITTVSGNRTDADGRYSEGEA
jgi:hypothetical protein